MIDLTTELAADVRRYCTGVPDYVLKSAIEQGARRFFHESLILTEQQELTAMTDLVLVLPDMPEAYIVDVVTVKTAHGCNIDARYASGSLQLSYNPNGQIVAELALCPKDSKVADWIYPRNKDALLHAAVRQLKTQQNQPWYDPDGASFHEAEYRHWCGVARIQNTPTKVTFTPFV